MYAQPGHEFYRRWVGLVDNTEGAADAGVQGYLRLSVAVWGAGEGVELALDLARAGREVRLLDPGEKFMPAPYIGSRAGWVMRWAGQAGLATEHGVTLDEVLPGKVSVTGPDGQEQVECTALILAPGRAPYDPFGRSLLGTPIEVQLIGDARKPRSYGNAIHEAAYLSRRI